MSEPGPTDNALSQIRDDLFRTGLNIDRALNLPPSPMDVERLAEMGDGVTVLILRQHWSQPDPDATLLRSNAAQNVLLRNISGGQGHRPDSDCEQRHPSTQSGTESGRRAGGDG